MTKNISHINSRIECPKCKTKTMRKAHGYSVGREYFDDRCHNYFSIDELVNQWGYDLGDFGEKKDNTWDIVASVLRKMDRDLSKIENQVTLQKKCSHPYLENFPKFVPELFIQNKVCVDCGKEFKSLEPRKEINGEWMEYKLVSINNWFDTESTVVMDEPVFKSLEDKLQSYEVVNRMFGNVEEWDLDGTTNEGIDTGLYR